MIDIGKKVLFFRHFGAFTGGHLKVWHYFNHLKHAQGYTPYISFSEGSLWDKTNPWLPIRHELLSLKPEEKPDIAFIAGMDWLRWHNENNDIPVVNLIQHVRHADPEHQLFSFLKNKAVRICVSEQVKDALVQTQQVNGPIYAIPNGVDLTKFPHALPLKEKKIDFLIAGLKNKALANALYERLKGLGMTLKRLTKPIPQEDYLAYMSEARCTIFLPNKTEGFYLPALEGMMLETLVICPDCIGNRSFCLPDVTCIQPEYSLDALLKSAHSALSMLKNEREVMLNNAMAVASQYTLERERHAFLDIMNNLTSIWSADEK